MPGGEKARYEAMGLPAAVGLGTTTCQPGSQPPVADAPDPVEERSTGLDPSGSSRPDSEGSRSVECGAAIRTYGGRALHAAKNLFRSSRFS